MNNHSLSIATRGILGNKSTLGYINYQILEITEEKLNFSNFLDVAGYNFYKDKKKIIIDFLFKDKKYVYEKIVPERLIIEIKDLEIKQIKNKPVIFFRKIINKEWKKN
jgi:hypothetical protein